MRAAFFLAVALATGPAAAGAGAGAGAGESALPPYNADAEVTLAPNKRGLGPTGAIDDGVIRVRFSKKTALRARYVFRATLGARGRRIERGYALRFSGARWWLEAIVDDRFERITDKAKLWRFARRRQLELVITLSGEHVMANLYDTARGQRTGKLFASGLTPGVGATGWLERGRDRPPKKVARISTRPLCRGLDVDVPLGDTIVARLIAPPDAASFPRAILVDDRPGPPREIVVRTDPLGIEQQICRGLSIVEFYASPPWKYLDDAFRNAYAARATGTPAPDWHTVDHSYPWPQRVVALLERWASRHPDSTRLVELGRSHQGRPIMAMAIGHHLDARADRPAILLNAGHHGDENLSTQIALDAVERILERDEPGADVWLDQLVIWAVPLVNPDGLDAFCERGRSIGRKNGRATHGDAPRPNAGVDLNRNYPFRWGALGEKGSRSSIDSRYYRGPDAASEPETRAMMQLAEREPFVASISYHTGTVTILAPYTIDGVENAEVNEAWTVAWEIARALGRHPQGRVFEVERKLYAVDGVDQDWHRARFGTMALLVESAFYPPIEPADRNGVVAAMRPSWRWLIDRFVRGPALTVAVRDAQGRPLDARVAIEGMEPPNGEAWRTRCPSGLYHRYLPAAGRYRIRVEAPGHRPVTRRIRVGSERARVDVELAPQLAPTAPARDPAIGTCAGPDKGPLDHNGTIQNGERTEK